MGRRKNATTKYMPIKKKNLSTGADLGFSRERGGFSKNFEIFVDLFLGRPNRFFQLSQSTVLSLFWPKFVRRRQSFEKTAQKRRF